MLIPVFEYPFVRRERNQRRVILKIPGEWSRQGTNEVFGICIFLNERILPRGDERTHVLECIPIGIHDHLDKIAYTLTMKETICEIKKSLRVDTSWRLNESRERRSVKRAYVSAYLDHIMELYASRELYCRVKHIIWKNWYDACGNPYNPIGKKRLLREFNEFCTEMRNA